LSSSLSFCFLLWSGFGGFPIVVDNLDSL
jgi:hypothetical protein